MHVVITGASSGIGMALAKEFADHGYKLTLVARRKEILEALASELNCPAFVVECDLGNLEQCCDWVESAEKQLGPVDVLINNAGIQYVESTVNISNERAEKLMGLNLLAPMRLINRVLPGMLQQKAGTLVNIASLVALNPMPWMYHYSASKSGLAAASETLQAELKGTGVSVLTVYPGPVATAMEKAARDKMQSFIANALPTGTPKKLAKLIRKAVKKKRERIVYPQLYEFSRIFRNFSQSLLLKFTPAPPES